jgi:hypothetical protein
MKTFRLSLILAIMSLVINYSFSQVNPNSPDYQRMKEQGLFPQPAQVTPVEPVTAITPSESANRNGGLLIPLDGTFSLAMAPNDDGYTDLLTLPFTFCFYGDDFTQLYINNNGNISFTTPYFQYSPTGFPSSDFIMIAPFWGDVDTRGDIGAVYYKMEANRMVVIWNEVGYFSYHGDLRNTFELIITDGNDPLIGIGNNVAFSYTTMQWTTGDASEGIGGFGGYPATVGVNKGDGVKYALVGRFDQPGTAFDGPGGANDGVGYLEGKLYIFNACEEDVVIPGEVPVSNWALFIGIALILVFAVIRFRRLV